MKQGMIRLSLIAFVLILLIFIMTAHINASVELVSSLTHKHNVMPGEE